jgi:hypothetical protein
VTSPDDFTLDGEYVYGAYARCPICYDEVPVHGLTLPRARTAAAEHLADQHPPIIDVDPVPKAVTRS